MQKVLPIGRCVKTFLEVGPRRKADFVSSWGLYIK